MPTTPPSITALPTPPDPNDRSTFNTRAYPWSVAQQTLATEVAAVAENVFDNATEAEASATLAGEKADEAAASVTAAAAQATAATTAKDGAEDARDAALVAAAAAGAAAGLPSMVGKALQGLRVKADESGVEFAPSSQFQRAGIFSTGAEALVPVSSGEQVMPTTGTATGTGASALFGVTRSNGLYVAWSIQPDRVVTAAAPTGPWTVRSFTSAGAITSATHATDGTNSVMVFGGVTATRKSADSVTWSNGGALTEAPVQWLAPASLGGVVLVKTITATTVNRSTDAGTSWAAATLPSAPLESKIFSVGGSFAYLTSANVVSSATGATGSWTSTAHNLGISISDIAQLPNGDVYFKETGTGQVYLMTSPASITKLTGVVCPLNHKPYRINGVWMFVPSSASVSPNGTGFTVHGGVAVPRAVLASLYTANGVSGLLPPYVELGGQTVLPGGQMNGINAPVLVVDHVTSPQAYFGA